MGRFDRELQKLRAERDKRKPGPKTRGDYETDLEVMAFDIWQFLLIRAKMDGSIYDEDYVRPTFAWSLERLRKEWDKEGREPRVLKPHERYTPDHIEYDLFYD